MPIVGGASERLALARRVTPDLGPEGDGEPVPPVDRDDRDREADELRFFELRAGGLVRLVGNSLRTEPRDRFRPGQRRALPRREEGRLAPDRDGVDALLGLALLPRVLRVHVHAERAAVQIRGAEPDEMEERTVDARRPDVLL